VKSDGLGVTSEAKLTLFSPSSCSCRARHLPAVSRLKQTLNPSASPTPYVDFVVLVRYTNQNAFTPVTTITQTNS
jgi:hypothetical protein